ncbi:class I SAM-dependent methyltransferase [soil metagenome]
MYTAKAADSVSWYQPEPAESLRMIELVAQPPARVLDVGGGASFLADRLVARGYRTGVLDIAGEPLRLVQERLGDAADDVEWYVTDVTRFVSPHTWDVWHDRAVFHFLTEPPDRSAYIDALVKATRAGSSVIIATFGPDGPTSCSGLPVARYSSREMQDVLGDGFELVESTREDHRTPGGGSQRFVYCRFLRD